MEFNCEKSDLLKGVQTVERIVSTRTTLPIIGNLLFEASKAGVKVSANNLEMGLEISLPAKVSKEGKVLIPAKTMSGVVSKLPNTNVGFKVNERNLVKLNYSQSNLSIHGLPSDEFPPLPKVKEGSSFSIDANLLSQMINETIFSVSTTEDKYVLNGVLMEWGKAKSENSNFRMVATDGYRLAMRGENIQELNSAEGSAIVPSKALAELSRAIKSGDGGAVNITVSKDQISFKYKDMYLVSRQIQGQFPAYRQVIPKNTTTKVTLSTQELLEGCERAAVIASASANVVRLEVKPSKLHIIASTPDVGSVEEVIEAQVKGKDKAQVAFNVRLLIEALKVFSSPQVVLEVAGPLSPGIVRPDGDADYVYIVMPIRTQETVS